MRGINIPLLEKRFKFFTRTLVGSMTTISRHNPEAAALFVDIGEISVRVKALIDFIKEEDKGMPTTPAKPKK